MIAGLIDGVLVASGLCAVLLLLTVGSTAVDTLLTFISAMFAGASAMIALLAALWAGWFVSFIFRAELKRLAEWVGGRVGLVVNSPVKRIEMFATQARFIDIPDGVDGCELDGNDPARCPFAVMRDEVVYGCRRRAEHTGLHANGWLRWGADKLVARWDRNPFKQLWGMARAYLRRSAR